MLAYAIWTGIASPLCYNRIALTEHRATLQLLKYIEASYVCVLTQEYVETQYVCRCLHYNRDSICMLLHDYCSSICPQRCTISETICLSLHDN